MTGGIKSTGVSRLSVTHYKKTLQKLSGKPHAQERRHLGLPCPLYVLGSSILTSQTVSHVLLRVSLFPLPISLRPLLNHILRLHHLFPNLLQLPLLMPFLLLAMRAESIKFLFITTAERIPIVLYKRLAIAFALFPLALLFFHHFHAFFVAVAVERDDLHAGKIALHKRFEFVEVNGGGAVGAAVVVDDEAVVCWILRRVIVRGPAAEISRGVSLLVERVFPFVGGFKAADEEFAGVGDVVADIAVHGVFGEKVDAKLLAGFGEAPSAVEAEDVCIDAAAAVIVDQVEELERHVFAWVGKGAVDGCFVVVVDAGVLVM